MAKYRNQKRSFRSRTGTETVVERDEDSGETVREWKKSKICVWCLALKGASETGTATMARLHGI